MRDQASFRLRALRGGRVPVQIASRELLPVAERIFSARRERVGELEGNGPLVRLYDDGPGYTLEGPSGIWYADQPGEALAWYEAELSDLLLAGTEDLIHLHAAAVVGPRACAVLVGESRSGKSSLSLGLRNLGLSILSDDLAIIDPTSRRLVPFRRSLRVHREALRGHDGWKVLPEDAQLSEPYLWAHPIVGDRSEPQGPTDLVFLQRADTTELTPLGSAEALSLLLRGRFGPGLGARDFECCRELTLRARCHHLTVGKLAEAVDRLASVVFALSPARRAQGWRSRRSVDV